MGLYLCVFEDERELEGVEVGSYEDFHVFRATVSELLENKKSGERFPILMLHADDAGEWSADEALLLQLVLL